LVAYFARYAATASSDSSPGPRSYGPVVDLGSPPDRGVRSPPALPARGATAAPRRRRRHRQPGGPGTREAARVGGCGSGRKGVGLSFMAPSHIRAHGVAYTCLGVPSS
jgi:hypothetical protein